MLTLHLHERMTFDPDIEPHVRRFASKCRFDPATGCLIWTGAVRGSRAGEGKTGAFWFEGRNWVARRFAAKHIYGHDISEGREVFTTCGEDLCVRHITTAFPIINTRQHWLLVNLGYGDDEPEDSKAERLAREKREALAAIPPEERSIPDWFKPFAERE